MFPRGQNFCINQCVPFHQAKHERLQPCLSTHIRQGSRSCRFGGSSCSIANFPSTQPLWQPWLNSTCITLVELAVWLCVKDRLHPRNCVQVGIEVALISILKWGNKASAGWVARIPPSQKVSPGFSDSKSSLFYHTLLALQKQGVLVPVAGEEMAWFAFSSWNSYDHLSIDMAVALSVGCFWPERSKGTREQRRPPFNVQTSHLEILSVKLYILIQEVCISDKPPGWCWGFWLSTTPGS